MGIELTEVLFGTDGIYCLHVRIVIGCLRQRNLQLQVISDLIAKYYRANLITHATLSELHLHSKLDMPAFQTLEQILKRRPIAFEGTICTQRTLAPLTLECLQRGQFTAQSMHLLTLQLHDSLFFVRAAGSYSP